tara:strand:+ start:7191 stop:8645 length:1455 start_codon:yes stop_codon:yes gene_type:complete
MITENQTTGSKMPLALALLPIILLVALLRTNVYFFGDYSSSGSNQIALLISALIAGGIGMYRGVSWSALRDAISSNISQATEAIIILLLIGALTGSWLLAGIIPAFMHYGLLLLEPTIFLFAACIICAVLSIATGSSWGTVGTVGVALIGIGTAMGISKGWVAGAIISGAYFGDKLSPLSDTTNLAPAVSGTDLITHIKYMTITTVPSILITLVVFLVVGLTGGAVTENIEFASGFGEAIKSKFNINLGLFFAPIAVLIMIARKVPAAAALFIGVLLGTLTAIIFQPQAIREIAGEELSYAAASYYSSITSMAIDTHFVTGNELADELLGAKGMAGMMNTIWLIICAMVFGAVLQASSILKRITDSLISGVNSVLGLVGSTVGTCLAFNILASDQYIAIVVPGKMYADAYKEHGLAPENLSRTLEDAGTVTSVLIPWNTCGNAQSGILGVATLAYAPYCIFNWVSPIMSLFVAGFGYKLKRLEN